MIFELAGGESGMRLNGTVKVLDDFLYLLAAILKLRRPMGFVLWLVLPASVSIILKRTDLRSRPNYF